MTNPIEGPRRYVPPQFRPPPKVTYAKPWMAPRRGETEEQRMDRLAHSCCYCGLYLVSSVVLDAHENECPHQGNRGEPK